MSEPIVRGLPWKHVLYEWKHVLYGMIEDSAGILIHPAIDPETVPAVVHCVNCHDQLVAAIEGLTPILEAAESNASGNPEWTWVSPRINAARAALAAAKVPQ